MKRLRKNISHVHEGSGWSLWCKRVIIVAVVAVNLPRLMTEREIMKSTILNTRLGNKKEPFPLAENITTEMGMAHTNAPPPKHKWLLNNDNDNLISHSIIPKVINKVFIQHSGMMVHPVDTTPALIAAHQSWTKMNPGYKLHYFDLSKCRKYLENHFHPVFLRAFDCLQAYAAKVDLFRAAVVFREGGWYSDWKQECFEDGLLDKLSSIGGDLVLFEGDKRFKRIQNAFFGAVPQHPMLAEVIQTILINVQSSNYDGSPWDTTSTGLFHRLFNALAKDNVTSIKQNLVGNFAFEEKERQWWFFVEGKMVVRHKFKEVEAHKWTKGNNYNGMFWNHQWYCPQAASLFQLEEPILWNDKEEEEFF